MDKIFMYAERDSAAYREVESSLRTLPAAERLVVLPAGLGFSSPESLLLRANDTVILYSEHINDLDKLISMRGYFKSYKIVLLVESESQLVDNNYLTLYPRLVLSTENGIGFVLNCLQYFL